MRKLAEAYVRIVSALQERVRFISLGLVIMSFIMLYEVIARFIFNAPTRWAWEMNQQLLCFMMVMAGGYVLLHKGHVKTDIFYARWSTKGKAWLDLVSSFLPLLFCGVLLIGLFSMAQESVVMREHSIGLWQAPLYPIKALMVLAVFLFLIQILAEAIRNLLVITNKK